MNTLPAIGAYVRYVGIDPFIPQDQDLEVKEYKTIPPGITPTVILEADGHWYAVPREFLEPAPTEFEEE